MNRFCNFVQENEIKMYLYEIDKNLKSELSSEIYDSSIEYIKISYIYGVHDSITEGDYYR